MVAKMSFTSDEILTTIDGRTDGQIDSLLMSSLGRTWGGILIDGQIHRPVVVVYSRVLTSEARRDMRLRGLQSGELSLSSCSFLRNSGGRRMSMGRDMRLLTSCSESKQVHVTKYTSSLLFLLWMESLACHLDYKSLVQTSTSFMLHLN